MSEHSRPFVIRVASRASARDTRVHEPNPIPEPQPVREPRSVRDSVDGAMHDLGALADAVGDQVRPVASFAVETADTIVSAVESARSAGASIWKELNLLSDRARSDDHAEPSAQDVAPVVDLAAGAGNGTSANPPGSIRSSRSSITSPTDCAKIRIYGPARCATSSKTSATACRIRP